MNENIEIFDLFSATLLKRLYDNFPQCVTIITEDELSIITDELKVYKINSKQEGTLYSETVYWLKNNGFIAFSYPTERPQTPTAISEFNCVELTLSGLSLLKSPTPATLNTKKSLGAELVDKFNNGLIREASKLTIDAIIHFGAK